MRTDLLDEAAEKLRKRGLSRAFIGDYKMRPSRPHHKGEAMQGAVICRRHAQLLLAPLARPAVPERLRVLDTGVRGSDRVGIPRIGTLAVATGRWSPGGHRNRDGQLEDGLAVTGTSLA